MKDMIDAEKKYKAAFKKFREDAVAVLKEEQELMERFCMMIDDVGASCRLCPFMRDCYSPENVNRDDEPFDCDEKIFKWYVEEANAD